MNGSSVPLAIIHKVVLRFESRKHAKRQKVEPVPHATMFCFNHEALLKEVALTSRSDLTTHKVFSKSFSKSQFSQNPSTYSLLVIVKNKLTYLWGS